MDEVKVEEERSTVPEWARAPGAGSAAQVTAEAVSGAPKITPPQRKYMLDLLNRKQIPDQNAGKIDLIVKCLRISEDPEEYGMSKAKASEILTWLEKRPDKPREQRQQAQQAAMNIAQIDERWCWEGVPQGRYAVNNEQGELRFYSVWISREHDRANLYVLHGPYDSAVPGMAAKLSILKKIKRDVRAAAIRYGLEIGECSNCGRRLTNRISRELGIGPVCGSRMFGDDFKPMIKEKREEIIARGEDPDEELE